MGFLDQSMKDLSVDDIRRLIRDEVALQVPAIPAAVAALGDGDVPVLHPPVPLDGGALVYDASTGGYTVGGLGVIDGSVSNEQIESLSGSKITAGTLSALLTLTGRLATALTGQRVEVDSGGVRSYDSSGGLEVDITADGTTSTFSGNLSTGSLQVNGGLTIDGTTNVMDKGSQLTLNQGQGDPTIGPVVTNLYDDVPATFTDSAFKVGMAYTTAGGSAGADGHTFTFITHAQPYLAGSTKLVERKVSDGSLVRQQAIDNTVSKTGSTILQTAIVGTDTYMVYETSGGVFKMDKYNQSWVYQSTTNLSALFAGSSAGSLGFGLTGDGTNLIGVQMSGTGSGKVARVITFTTAGALVSSTAQTGGFSSPGSGYLVQGAGWDASASRLWVLFSNNTFDIPFCEEYNLGTNAAVASSGFAIDMSTYTFAIPRGIASDGTNVWTLLDQEQTFQTTSGWLRLSAFTWTPGTDRWHFGYVWNTAGHSKVSPIANMNLASTITGMPYARGRLSITVPTFPTGITQVDWYVLNNSTAGSPAATALLLQAPTTYVSSNTISVFRQILYNSGGAAAANTNTFAAGTSNIMATFTAGTPWNLGGDGTFVVPAMTTANRIAAPASGQLGLNTSFGGLEFTQDAGTSYAQLYGQRDTEDIYDALNNLGSLSGVTGYPLAYTIDPEGALGDLGMTSGDMRGACFMVKKPVSTAAIGYIISVASNGAITNYLGATLMSMNSSGDWVFIANTGASKATSFTNTTGLHTMNWRDSGDTVDTTYALVPGTVYVATVTFPSYVTTQPKVLVNAPAATASNIQANLGITGLRRSAIVTASVTAKRTTNVTSANLSNVTNIPLWLIY